LSATGSQKYHIKTPSAKSANRNFRHGLPRQKQRQKHNKKTQKM